MHNIYLIIFFLRRWLRSLVKLSLWYFYLFLFGTHVRVTFPF